VLLRCISSGRIGGVVPWLRSGSQASWCRSVSDSLTGSHRVGLHLSATYFVWLFSRFRLHRDSWSKRLIVGCICIDGAGVVLLGDYSAGST
jgi:hypothetical protein